MTGEATHRDMTGEATQRRPGDITGSGRGTANQRPHLSPKPRRNDTMTKDERFTAIDSLSDAIKKLSTIDRYDLDVRRDSKRFMMVRVISNLQSAMRALGIYSLTVDDNPVATAKALVPPLTQRGGA